MRPLLALVKEATNWTDPQIGDLIGMPRSTVQAVICGRTPEYLTDHQKQLMADELRGFLEDGAEALAEIEMRS